MKKWKARKQERQRRKRREGNRGGLEESVGELKDGVGETERSGTRLAVYGGWWPAPVSHAHTERAGPLPSAPKLMGRRRGWGGDTAQRGWTEAEAKNGGADGAEQGEETKDRVDHPVRWRHEEMTRAHDGLNCRWRTKEQRGLWLSEGITISAVCCWTLYIFTFYLDQSLSSSCIFI